MYVLTIVFLFSRVSITSLHASEEACQLAASRARAFDVGLQAVAAARCDPVAVPVGEPARTKNE